MTEQTTETKKEAGSSGVGYAIAGDPIYATGAARRGPAGLDRLFLHSWRIEMAAVDGQRLIRAEAPLPQELDSVLDRLRSPNGAVA